MHRSVTVFILYDAEEICLSWERKYYSLYWCFFQFKPHFSASFILKHSLLKQVMEENWGNLRSRMIWPLKRH